MISIATFPEIWVPNGVNLKFDPAKVADITRTMSDEQYYALRSVAAQNNQSFESLAYQYMAEVDARKAEAAKAKAEEDAEEG